MGLVTCDVFLQTLKNVLNTASDADKAELCALLSCGVPDLTAEQVYSKLLDCNSAIISAGTPLVTCQQLTDAFAAYTPPATPPTQPQVYDQLRDCNNAVIPAGTQMATCADVDDKIANIPPTVLPVAAYNTPGVISTAHGQVLGAGDKVVNGVTIGSGSLTPLPQTAWSPNALEPNIIFGADLLPEATAFGVSSGVNKVTTILMGYNIGKDFSMSAGPSGNRGVILIGDNQFTKTYQPGNGLLRTILMGSYTGSVLENAYSTVGMGTETLKFIGAAANSVIIGDAAAVGDNLDIVNKPRQSRGTVQSSVVVGFEAGRRLANAETSSSANISKIVDAVLIGNAAARNAKAAAGSIVIGKAALNAQAAIGESIVIGTAGVETTGHLQSTVVIGSHTRVTAVGATGTVNLTHNPSVGARVYSVSPALPVSSGWAVIDGRQMYVINATTVEDWDNDLGPLSAASDIVNATFTVMPEVFGSVAIGDYAEVSSSNQVVLGSPFVSEVRTSGVVYAAGYVTTSDARLKSEISTVDVSRIKQFLKRLKIKQYDKTNVLSINKNNLDSRKIDLESRLAKGNQENTDEIVKELAEIKFNLASLQNVLSKREIGLIADEVLEVLADFPEFAFLVSEQGPDKIKTVDYDSIHNMVLAVMIDSL